MTFRFVMEKASTSVEIPYIEDARVDFAPYYSSRMTELQAKSAISEEMDKLGGFVTRFDEGRFENGQESRYGYEVHFMYGGAPGIIRVAGLPIRYQATPKKVAQVRVQALLNVRDWLKNALTAQVFAPGSNQLLMHLLLPDGKTTIAEYIAEKQDLPLLNPPPQQIVIER